MPDLLHPCSRQALQTIDKDTQRKIKDNQRKKYARSVKRREAALAAEALSATLPQKFSNVFAAMHAQGAQPMTGGVGSAASPQKFDQKFTAMNTQCAQHMVEGIGNGKATPNTTKTSKSAGAALKAPAAGKGKSLPNKLRAQQQQPQQIPPPPPSMAAPSMAAGNKEWRVRARARAAEDKWATMSESEKVDAMVKEFETDWVAVRGDSGKAGPSIEECMDVFADDWASASVSDKSGSNTETGSR